MMFFVFSKPCGGIAADGEDFEVFGAGNGRNALHQTPCRPLPAQGLRRKDIFQGKDATVPLVIGIGGMALLDQLETGFTCIVCDFLAHTLEYRAG